jgi:glutamate synthase domain-containing protein 1
MIEENRESARGRGIKLSRWHTRFSSSLLKTLSHRGARIAALKVAYTLYLLKPLFSSVLHNLVKENT